MAAPTIRIPGSPGGVARRRVVLAGDSRATVRLMAELDARHDLDVSVAVGRELVALCARGALRPLVVFLDPGDRLPDASGLQRRCEDGYRDDWRDIHAALSDVTVDAQAADLVQSFEHALSVAAGDVRPPCLSVAPALDHSSALAVHELASQWGSLGRDPQSVELIALLRQTAKHVRIGADTVLAGYGLSREFFDILAALYRADAGTTLTQAQLAGRMFVTQAGMKKRLGRLQEMDMVVRSVDAKDARQYRLTLTVAGRAVLEGVLNDFFAAEEDSLAGLTGDEQAHLRGLLQRILAGSAPIPA